MFGSRLYKEQIFIKFGHVYNDLQIVIHSEVWMGEVQAVKHVGLRFVHRLLTSLCMQLKSETHR